MRAALERRAPLLPFEEPASPARWTGRPRTRRPPRVARAEGSFGARVEHDLRSLGMQSRDYFERMIQSLATAVARITGLTAEGKWDEAERALDEEWSSALAFRRGDVARLDGATLRSLFGAKAVHAATLVDAEAALDEARG